MCQCFYKCLNRDLNQPAKPYAELVYTSEDECLSFCHRDQRCKWTWEMKLGLYFYPSSGQSVVYGIVGGREGITCELYDSPPGETVITDNLMHYQYGMNWYFPLDIRCAEENCKFQVVLAGKNNHEFQDLEFRMNSKI